jgi:hypothetical protein
VGGCPGNPSILIANFGLNAINILMDPPTELSYDGSIPHTCAHCLKVVIEPKTRQISSTFLVTEYVFQAEMGRRPQRLLLMDVHSGNFSSGTF